MPRFQFLLDGPDILLLGSMLGAFDIMAAEFGMLPAPPLYALLGPLFTLTFFVGGLQILCERSGKDWLSLLADMTH